MWRATIRCFPNWANCIEVAALKRVALSGVAQCPHRCQSQGQRETSWEAGHAFPTTALPCRHIDRFSRARRNAGRRAEERRHAEALSQRYTGKRLAARGSDDLDG